MCNSKIKLFLQYLKNIDSQLHNYFIDLIDDNETFALTLILTELKLFLQEMIIYFENNSTGYLEIPYEVKISNSTNVIYKIFKENTTIKILYNLGLTDIKIKSYELVIFKLNNIIHIKHKLLANFLSRFICEIKNYNKNIML